LCPLFDLPPVASPGRPPMFLFALLPPSHAHWSLKRVVQLLCPIWRCVRVANFVHFSPLPRSPFFLQRSSYSGNSLSPLSSSFCDLDFVTSFRSWAVRPEELAKPFLTPGFFKLLTSRGATSPPSNFFFPPIPRWPSLVNLEACRRGAPGKLGTFSQASNTGFFPLYFRSPFPSPALFSLHLPARHIELPPPISLLLSVLSQSKCK